MLIRITRHCDMGCRHCMIEAEPDGRHMETATLAKVADFLEKIPPVPLVISGGEPLAHPKFLLFITYLLKRGLPRELMVIASNGEALQDPANLAMMEVLGVKVNVTNDRRFYPRQVTLPPHPLIHFFDKMPAALIPLGRGRNLTSDNPRKGPDCFNLRSMVRNSGLPLPEAMLVNTLRGRSCTPCIDYDGSIYLGEHNLCQRIGGVEDPIERLTEAVRNLRCDFCGLCGTLPAEYRKAIGM